MSHLSSPPHSPPRLDLVYKIPTMDGVYVDKKHLRFMVPYDGMVTSDTVKVSNTSDTAVTFKMKTTTDKNGFVVQPKTGIVPPDSSAEITITYKCDIERNPRLRLDVVPYTTSMYALAPSSAEFWERREAVFRNNISNNLADNNDSQRTETTEDLTLASLPLYKYNFHVGLVTFDERKKPRSLDTASNLECADGNEPQRTGLVFQSTRSTDSLLVENHTDDPVTYRVRTTDDAVFCVEPSSGQVEAHGSVEVTCVFNGYAANEYAHGRKHFVIVDVANISHENPPKFWGDVDSGKTRMDILKHKFKAHIEAPRSRFVMEDNIEFATSSCLGPHGLSFRSHHHSGGKDNNRNRKKNKYSTTTSNKKARTDSTTDYHAYSRFGNNDSPSWFGAAFEKHTRSNFSRSYHADDINYDDGAPCSLPNIKDDNRPGSNNRRKRQASPRTLSRTISDVWDNLRRQPSFLLRNSRGLQRV